MKDNAHLEDKFGEWLAGLASNVGSRNAGLLRGVYYGINAGLEDEEIAERIIDASGTPPLTPDEVWRAIQTARAKNEENGGNCGFTPRRRHGGAHGRTVRPPAPSSKWVKGVVRRLADEDVAEEPEACSCGDVSLRDLAALSPVPLPEGGGDGERRQRASLFLSRLYLPGDFLFVGNLTDTAVKTRTEWEALLETAQPDQWPERLGSNPFTGREGRTSGGKASFRCLGSVASFRFALMEFDAMDLDYQIRFWRAVIRRNALPVAAITYSGNKSLHALLRLDAATSADFARHWVRLAETFASPHDPPAERCDLACRDASRLTRLPEARNAKTGNVQRLVYLA